MTASCMKRILLLFFAVSFAMCFRAQNNENPLVGVWQQCIIETDDNGEKHPVAADIVKVVSEDNTYFVILGSGTKSAKVITQQGRWYLQNDSVFHEQIDRHYMAPYAEKTSTVLKYKFLGDDKDFILLEFKMSGTNSTMREIWRRVLPMR